MTPTCRAAGYGVAGMCVLERESRVLISNTADLQEGRDAGAEIEHENLMNLVFFPVVVCRPVMRVDSEVK